MMVGILIVYAFMLMRGRAGQQLGVPFPVLARLSFGSAARTSRRSCGRSSGCVVRRSRGSSAGTVGVINALPGAINVVPGEVELDVDAARATPRRARASWDGLLRSAESLCARRVSSAGGIGHHPDAYTAPAQLDAGVDVLTRVLARRAEATV